MGKRRCLLLYCYRGSAMTDYPLPTLACTIDENGISAPPYNDILLSLQAQYRAIYGADTDLDEDTQDGQWLAIQAKAINDSNQQQIFVYNQFSPSTAIGTGLSSVVKINNIQRLVPSNSTAVVAIVGQVGRIITNGIIGDNVGLNTKWTLPASVTIPISGTINVTATCTEPGAILADANTLTVILTPTAGWQSVTNAANAAPGQPVEVDAQLRRRQSISTQSPSKTVLGGIVGRIADLVGVSHYKAFENDTDTPDADSLPPHSICLSVLGGNLQAIVDIIGSGKADGCSTYGGGTGATSGVYTDPISGVLYTINFNIPTEITILVAVHITALAGYSSAVGDEIKAAVVAAINDLGIGDDVLYTRLYAPALLVGPYGSPPPATPPNLSASTYELTSVLIAASPGSPSAADVVIAFNQIAVSAVAHVTLVVV